MGRRSNYFEGMVSVTDFKHDFHECLDLVISGRRIILTRSKKPVVALVSLEDLEKLEKLDGKEKRLPE